MTRPGKQWKTEDLPLGTVREHPNFQYRVDGTNKLSVQKIVGTLEAGGETRDPIRVARVGDNLYVVDGFHRLEAYRRCRRASIPALVAKMSLEEARKAARAFNAMNGKPYSRADKAAMWDAYLAKGEHRDAWGNPKTARAISTELGGLYSHETIRKKLREAGELDEDSEYGGHYKPFSAPETEEEMLEVFAGEAADGLRTFAERIGGLSPTIRLELLNAAKEILEDVERGREPDISKVPNYDLDI